MDAIRANHNHTPRKCLGCQTPVEAFSNPSHFDVNPHRIKSGATAT